MFGLKRSIDFLESFGYSEGRIEAHNLAVRDDFYEYLSEVVLKEHPDVVMYSPRPESELKSPLVTISLGKRTPLSCFSYLYQKDVVIKMVSNNQRGSNCKNAVRFAFHGYNTKEEGRELVDALKSFLNSTI